MQRYSVTDGDTDADVFEDHDGYYVLYTDAQAALAAKDQELARLKQAQANLLAALERITKSYADLHEGDGEENEALIASMRAVIARTEQP